MIKNKGDSKKICVVIGASMNLHSLYRDQFKYLQKQNFEVLAIASPGIEHDWLNKDGIKTKKILFKREPSLFYDLLSLLRLTFFFTFNRFDIISVSTPKASLIGGISAYITLQKKIIYTLRGRVYENYKGLKKIIFENVEKLVCSISDKVFCISREIKEDVISKGICKSSKIFVLGSGSSNGVDLNKFTRTDENIKKGTKIRKSLGISGDDILILYSGRIRKEKGINELVNSFEVLSKKYKNIHLLLQGKYEDFDPLNESILEKIKINERIHRADWVKDVVPYFAAADIFAFPSYREGFGNVAIEASAMEMPVVGFNVTGLRESVVNGVTGLLSDDISSESLTTTLDELIKNEEYRNLLGKNGRKRVVLEFDSRLLWSELVKVYNTMLSLNSKNMKSNS